MGRTHPSRSHSRHRVVAAPLPVSPPLLFASLPCLPPAQPPPPPISPDRSAPSSPQLAALTAPRERSSARRLCSPSRSLCCCCDPTLVAKVSYARRQGIVRSSPRYRTLVAKVSYARQGVVRSSPGDRMSAGTAWRCGVLCHSPIPPVKPPVPPPCFPAAAPGQAWSALVPWGCALYASQAGVAARIMVGCAGEVPIGEGKGGWADSAAASSTLQSEAAGAASEQRGAGLSGGEGGAAGGAGRLVEQQGPSIKEESAGGAGGGDQPAHSAAVGAAAVEVTDGASTAVGASDGSIATVDASHGSTSAGSNSGKAGGSSEAAEQAEQAACEGAALTEEAVRAWQAEEHAAFGRVQVEGGVEGKGSPLPCPPHSNLTKQSLLSPARQRAFLVALIALQRRQGSTEDRTDAHEGGSGSGSSTSGSSADVLVQGNARVTEVPVAVSAQARAAAGRAAVLLEAWERGGEGGEGEQGEDGERGENGEKAEVEEGGGVDVRMAAQVTYHPGNSSHQVCYQLPLPGRYVLSLHLLFSATFPLLGSNARTSFLGGFSNYTVVHSQAIQASAPRTFFLHAHRATLPYCTPPLLTASHHSGYWMGHLWQPHACRLRRLSPPAMHACFNGRSLLFLGDSQLRYTFAFLRFLLRFPSRAAFLTKFAAKPKVFWPNMLACGSVPRGNGSIYPPVSSSTGELISTGVCQQPGSTFFFHGENFNGYGRAMYKEKAAAGSPSFAFNLTYVSQCGSMKPVFPAWMSDPALVGPALTLFDSRPDARSAAGTSHESGDSSSSRSSSGEGSSEESSSGGSSGREGRMGEYDMALVATTLHDLIQHPTARAFGALMESNLLPPVLAVMRDPSAVTLLGPWAAREDNKPPEFIPVSNNARAMAFEHELLRRLPSTQPGAASALGMMGLTLPRPDLCPDSTHYAWPVTLAILDLWLTPLCAPHASQAPQH
ncbi:unnamed protein product [Closterium sp. NIES-53]